MCNKPCRQCPYRTGSAQGFFGGNDPGYYFHGALSDSEVVVCHTTIGTDVETPCRGALSFAANSHKRPKSPDKASLVEAAGRRDDVLNSRTFGSHHKLAIYALYPGI